MLREWLTVSRSAPSLSPKVISTTVASGSESWSIITTGVGMVSVSPWFPSCSSHKTNWKQIYYVRFFIWGEASGYSVSMSCEQVYIEKKTPLQIQNLKVMDLWVFYLYISHLTHFYSKWPASIRIKFLLFTCN